MSRSTCITQRVCHLAQCCVTMRPELRLPPVPWRRWLLRPLLRAWAVLACEVPLGDA
jgi:hypothetical protein